MVDWNDIKKAFEKDYKSPEQLQLETEQRLITTIAAHLSSQKGLTSLQGYKPAEITAFLEKPIAEVKKLLGGEWAAMEDDKLETLFYTLTKKLKKADGLTQW
ncbi:MAG: hypothetical protein IJZ82_04800 [Lachnospiraceae bacterium]|nr:hypothetical protein [Lachnospiraceae bacterium]